MEYDSQRKSLTIVVFSSIATPLGAVDELGAAPALDPNRE
jgi:hypothetical protein